MLRQNHSGGSSTSRSLVRLPCYWLSGRPSNSATNNVPGTFSFTEPLFLIPSVQTEIQESGSTSRCHTFFEGTTFPHARPAEPVRVEAAREIEFATGPPHSFRGNHFSSFLPAEIGCPATPVDRL